MWKLATSSGEAVECNQQSAASLTPPPPSTQESYGGCQSKNVLPLRLLRLLLMRWVIVVGSITSATTVYICVFKLFCLLSATVVTWRHKDALCVDGSPAPMLIGIDYTDITYKLLS